MLKLNLFARVFTRFLVNLAVFIFWLFHFSKMTDSESSFSPFPCWNSEKKHRLFKDKKRKQKEKETPAAYTLLRISKNNTTGKIPMLYSESYLLKVSLLACCPTQNVGPNITSKGNGTHATKFAGVRKII